LRLASRRPQRRCPIPEGYKRAITSAASQDAVRFEAFNDFIPSPETKGYGKVVRAVRTPFIDEWLGERELASLEAERLREIYLSAVREGRVHELMPTAGQTVGGIREVLPAAEIVERMVAEAERALHR
jgi:NAD(P)H-dependent flavin oxidoreductase YrpB (nitropropane dioxygenase family)